MHSLLDLVSYTSPQHPIASNQQIDAASLFVLGEKAVRRTCVRDRRSPRYRPRRSVSWTRVDVVLGLRDPAGQLANGPSQVVPAGPQRSGLLT
jgi:hypothetical protein